MHHFHRSHLAGRKSHCKHNRHSHTLVSLRCRYSRSYKNQHCTSLSYRTYHHHNHPHPGNQHKRCHPNADRCSCSQHRYYRTGSDCLPPHNHHHPDTLHNSPKRYHMQVYLPYKWLGHSNNVPRNPHHNRQSHRHKDCSHHSLRPCTARNNRPYSDRSPHHSRRIVHHPRKNPHSCRCSHRRWSGRWVSKRQLNSHPSH